MVELVDTLVLEASTSVCEFESRLGHQIWVVSSVGRASRLHRECRQFETVTTHHSRRNCMSKQQEVIDRAYGSIPKEVGVNFEFSFIPTWRGLKYYWYKLTRKVTR